MRSEEARNEAALFAWSYIKSPISSRLKDRYAHFLAIQPVELTRSDEAVLTFARKHPWAISMLDAGLSLQDPQAEFRRRLYAMFALLESDPEYADYFLAQRRNPSYFFYVGLVGVKATLKIVAGIILLKVVLR